MSLNDDIDDGLKDGAIVVDHSKDQGSVPPSVTDVGDVVLAASVEDLLNNQEKVLSVDKEQRDKLGVDTKEPTVHEVFGKNVTPGEVPEFDASFIILDTQLDSHQKLVDTKAKIKEDNGISKDVVSATESYIQYRYKPNHFTRQTSKVFYKESLEDIDRTIENSMDAIKSQFQTCIALSENEAANQVKAKDTLLTYMQKGLDLQLQLKQVLDSSEFDLDTIYFSKNYSVNALIFGKGLDCLYIYSGEGERNVDSLQQFDLTLREVRSLLGKVKVDSDNLTLNNIFLTVVGKNLMKLIMSNIERVSLLLTESKTVLASLNENESETFDSYSDLAIKLKESQELLNDNNYYAKLYYKTNELLEIVLERVKELIKPVIQTTETV